MVIRKYEFCINVGVTSLSRQNRSRQLRSEFDLSTEPEKRDLTVKRFALLTVFVLFLFVTVRPAQAWNYAGHRIIAAIAWDQLTPERRRELVQLLKQHPRFEQDFQSRMPQIIKDATPEIQARWLFMRAATWPDIARSFKDADREKYHHGTWHYINQPIYLDEASKNALSTQLSANVAISIKAGDDVLGFNIIQALEYCVAQLKDPRVSQADKAVYFCWVMHLVGDSHQPLHSSALFSQKMFPEGDRGGNDIRIAKSNLHSQWDGLLGNSFKDSEIVGQAVGIERDPANKRFGESAAGDLNFVTWINESHELAREKGYSVEILEAARVSEAEGGKFQKLSSLPQSYYRQAGSIAVKRAAQAGWRLAAVLEGVK